MVFQELFVPLSILIIIDGMKRILILSIMFWNLLFGHAAQPADWANKERYAQENAMLRAAGEDSLRVVLMGNSITEYWFELHPSFFTTHHLVGRGISGQVSSQMLARFRQDVLSLNPRIVVINGGTNDIAENNGPYDQDITMDNIQSMTELALAHGIEVVVSSVLPCDKFCWNPSVKDAPEKILHLNQRIKEYATSRAHVHYLDYYPSMTLDGNAMNPQYTDDGVHPNSQGYDVMEVKLLEMLDELQH